MRFKVHLVVLLAISSYQSELVNCDSKLLIRDLLLHWKIPLHVTLKTCWTLQENHSFIKLFFNSGRFGVTNVGVSANHHSVIVMDLTCHKPLELPNTDFFRTRWIFLHSKNVLKSREVQNRIFLEFFETIDLSVNSEIMYVIKIRDLFEIRKVFKYSGQDPLVQELFGYWQEGRPIQSNLSVQVNTIRRWNLQGVNFNALVICASKNDAATRVSKVLTTAMALQLNATINFHCINGWDNELLHFLQTDSTSLGVTPSYMTPERLNLVRFLAMTGPIDYKFIFRSPKLSYTDNVFALTFHKHVWLSIMVTILLASIFQLIIFRVEERQSESRNNLDGFSGVLLNMISIVSQLDSLDNSRSISSRTLNIFMLIGLMFLYICFSARIIALIQSPSNRIRTLADLLHSGMQLGAQNSTINLNFMKVSVHHNIFYVPI